MQGEVSYLFYATSRAECWWIGEGGMHWACGGDIHMQSSQDSGMTWLPSKVSWLYTFQTYLLSWHHARVDINVKLIYSGSCASLQVCEYVLGDIGVIINLTSLIEFMRISSTLTGFALQAGHLLV